MYKPYHMLHICGAVLPVFVAAGEVLAVVETIDATVTAQVQEYVGENIVNSDFAFEDLDESTGNLPLVVDVLFLNSDTPDQVAGAVASTTFNDPRLSQDPDPDEFGIDVATFSQSPVLSYDGLSNSTETRTITFQSSEIGEPNGTALQVRSQFFVDGMMVLFSDMGVTDLSTTTAEFSLNVKQQRAGAEDFTTVLEASLIMTGQPDGTVIVTTDGELETDNIIQPDLGPSIPELGTFQMVIIPDLAIPYTYSANVGETFTLVAEIEGKVRNQPGTGASVQLGVPLLELAGLLNDVTGSDTGSIFSDLLQTTLVSGLLPAKPLTGNRDMEITVVKNNDLRLLGIPFCGVLGIESILLMMPFAALLYLPRRRRW